MKIAKNKYVCPICSSINDGWHAYNWPIKDCCYLCQRRLFSFYNSGVIRPPTDDQVRDMRKLFKQDPELFKFYILTGKL
jgi:hypothetical protein